MFDRQLSRRIDAAVVALERIPTDAVLRAHKAQLERLAFDSGKVCDPITWELLRQGRMWLDGWTCQGCGRRGIQLDVHHIIPRQQGGLDMLHNLISLCRRCHARIHTWMPPQ